jgi:hypothetical protein
MRSGLVAADPIRHCTYFQTTRYMRLTAMRPQAITRPREENMSTSTDVTETESTRYLCAGMHLDRAFRHQVIEQLFEEEHRAVEIPYGLDVEAVSYHAASAERRATIRSVLLLPIFVIAAFYYISLSAQEGDAGELYIPMYLLWLIAAIVVFVESIIRNKTLRTLRKGYDGARAHSKLEVSAHLRGRVQRNLVVYSGFSPFVGSGNDLGGWSFVVRLDKARDTLGIGETPISFKNSELYAHIRSRLTGLSPEGLLIQDKLYVNGQDIRGDDRFLPSPTGPPVYEVDSGMVDNFIDNPSQTVRHYMAIHLVQWKGELVVSCFIRVNQLGQHLFVEASYFLLPPVKENYYSVDSLPPFHSAKEIWTLAIGSIFSAPILCAFSPFAIWSKLVAPLHRMTKARQTKQAIENNYSFDYGATNSIRAIAASPNYRRYFQKLDKEMGVKLVERSLLDSIVEFLDEKNVDTSDLKERKSMILNNGVIVSGGYIQTETFTGGQGAISEMLPRISRATNRQNSKPTEKI